MPFVKAGQSTKQNPLATESIAIVEDNTKEEEVCDNMRIIAISRVANHTL
jgi:hypothetical protein